MDLSCDNINSFYNFSQKMRERKKKVFTLKVKIKIILVHCYDASTLTKVLFFKNVSYVNI